MAKFIQKIFDIREGEGLNASLMFIYIFFIIASLLIIKPVRNSLFLTHFGISQLPNAFILVAVFAGIITTIYSNVIKKIKLNLLIFYSTLLFIICLIIFWVMFYFKIESGWLYYTFYIWVALFGVISTSQFWLLANYVFNAREAKRLFSFVGSGAISGGIFGGYLTNFIAPFVGTANMLLFCICFLILCLVILKIIWKKSARYTYKEKILQEKRIHKNKNQGSALKSIIESKHLSYLAGIIGIGVIVANLVDYQFNAIATNAITDKDQLTAFFGFWLSNLSIVSLAIQLFITSKILKFFGVTTSLFFLPVGILIGAVLILLNPTLFSAIIIKISEGSFKQSINKSGFELLILPIPGNIKNQAKSFIDIFIDSLATGIGGILLIIATVQLNLSIEYISIIIILLILLWIYLINQVKYEYINSFRSALEKRSIDLDFQNINVEDASVFKSFINILSGKNNKQILYVLNLIENVKNDAFIPVFEKLLKNKSSEIVIKVLQILKNYENDRFFDTVLKFIDHENYEVKIRAIQYLFHHTTNGKLLALDLLNHDDYKIKSAALLCSAYENRSNKDFRTQFDIVKMFNDFIEHCYNSNYNDSEIHFMKVNLIKVIGVADNQELHPYLNNFLNDNCREILETAIRNTGKTRNPIFIPKLIEYLNINSTKNLARVSLAEFGEGSVRILSEYLENSDTEKKIRLEIPKVLSLIGTQNSVNLLIKNLDHFDLDLRFQILKALNKIKVKFPLLKFDKQQIYHHIFSEANYYYKTLSSLYQNAESNKSVLQIKPDNSKINFVNAQNLLIKALEEKLTKILERIFRLLGLRYIPKDMYNSYLGIISNKSDLQANAIEFLDNILSGKLKKIIIPIVENNSPDQILYQTDDLFDFKLPSDEECFRFLLTGNDNWLKACTIFFLSQMDTNIYNQQICNLQQNQDKIVAETATLYFKNT